MISDEMVVDLFQSIIDNKCIRNYNNIDEYLFLELQNDIEEVVADQGEFEPGEFEYKGHEIYKINHKTFVNSFCWILEKWEYESNIPSRLNNILKSKSNEVYFISKNRFDKKLYDFIFFSLDEVKAFLDLTI